MFDAAVGMDWFLAWFLASYSACPGKAGTGLGEFRPMGEQDPEKRLVNITSFCVADVPPISF